MRVLGVDPGLTRCGYGVVESARGGAAPSLVTVGVVRTTPAEEHGKRLVRILSGLREVIEQVHPDAIALERLFANNQKNTVMGVAQVSGLVIYEAASRDLPLQLMTPSEVKNSVTGFGGADKAQVGEMVRRLLRLKAVPKPADAADALALAIAASWRATRGIPGVNTGSGRDSTVTPAGATPAQRAWREAERRNLRQY